MSIHSLTTIDVYSKTYWTGFIAAVNEEAAYELGIHDKINPYALPNERGWSASRFTPNILRHTVYIGSISAFLSDTWSDYQRFKATYEYTCQVKIELLKKPNDKTCPIKPLLHRIVDIKYRIDRTRYEHFRSYFWACPVILFGGGLFTLGVVMKQSDLIFNGKCFLAISAIYTAAIASLGWLFKDDIRTTYNVIASAPDYLAETALSHLHWHYSEKMVLLQFSVPPYQPFFVDIPDGYAPVCENNPPTTYAFKVQTTPLGNL